MLHYTQLNFERYLWRYTTVFLGHSFKWVMEERANTNDNFIRVDFGKWVASLHDVSMIWQKLLPKMGLVQRAMSILRKPIATFPFMIVFVFTFMFVFVFTFTFISVHVSISWVWLDGCGLEKWLISVISLFLELKRLGCDTWEIRTLLSPMKKNYVLFMYYASLMDDCVGNCF